MAANLQKIDQALADLDESVLMSMTKEFISTNPDSGTSDGSCQSLPGRYGGGQEPV